MLPRGFFGTRADILMDVVIASLVIIIPVLALSWWWARRREWARHKRTQVGLAVGLGIAVLLFELDLRLAGGIFELTRESRFHGSALLDGTIYVHLFFSVTTSIVWIALIVLSLRRFPSPPRPSAFSRAHRLWGTLGMIDMILTGLTGLALYVLGFAL